MGLGGVRVALERGLQGGELRLDLPHAGTAREIRGERLLRREVTLLREIADAQRGRIARDRTAVERLEPGERAQERRLAAAVRPDDADPAPGRDRKRDALENRVRAAMDGDVCCGKRAALLVHRRTS